MTILSLALNASEPRLHALPWTAMSYQMDMAASCLVMASDGSALAIKYVDAWGFLSRVKNKSIDAELLKIKEMSQWAYLIIGGEFKRRDNEIDAGGYMSKMSPAALDGALLSVQEHGVALLHIDKIDALPDAVEMLAKRKRHPKRIKPPRDVLFLDAGEDILMSLPGVGQERAQALLSHCGGSPAWSLVALTDAVSDVPGIGAETRHKVRAALGLDEDMHFQVWIQEGSKTVE